MNPHSDTCILASAILVMSPCLIKCYELVVFVWVLVYLSPKFTDYIYQLNKHIL